MERKIYLKPAVKVLDTDTDRTMFEPGGGVSDPNPEPPVVNQAAGTESQEESFEFFELRQRSVWED